jgi:hypothetical protein
VVVGILFLKAAVVQIIRSRSNCVVIWSHDGLGVVVGIFARDGFVVLVG